MPIFPRKSSVCLRCVLQRRQSSTSAIKQPFPPASGKVHLDSRRLVSVQGTDASRFLQGLTTNNVRTHQTNGWYCAFLSATGRVLWDAFVYPVHWSRKYRDWLNGGTAHDTQGDPGYLVEVDAGEVDAFVRHLKRHKLRAKVSVRAVEPDAFSVWSVWRKEERWTPHNSSLAAGLTGDKGAGAVAADATVNPDSAIQLVDGRAPGFGRRLVMPAGRRAEMDLDSAQMLADLPDAPPKAYKVRRYLHGIPEGSAEIHRDSALPLEHNIDYMGGIDFRKGCYIGQELTIRTHHTGVVRKRILPVALYSASSSDSMTTESSAQPEYNDEEISTILDAYPPAGTEMKKIGGKGRSVGRWVAGVGNIGLGLCRLETMTDIRLTAEAPQWSPEQRFEMRWVNEDAEKQIGVRAFVPEWHRGKERVRSPPKRVG